MRVLRAHDPWWIEEPTSPDDVLGHARIRREVAPVRVATGEHVQNRVIFKQLFQAGAIDVCQIDACRIGGRQRGDRRASARGQVRGPGLSARGRRRASASTCSTSRSSTTSPSAARSRIAWSSGSTTCTSTSGSRRSSSDGRYLAPLAPGYSIEMIPSSLDEYEFPERPGVGAGRGRGGRRMTVAPRPEQPRDRAPRAPAPRPLPRCCRRRCCSLRAGPALILLLLIVVVSLTTPIFFTSRNIGNVFSQTSVIAVVALGQLLVIVTRGIDLSVGVHRSRSPASSARSSSSTPQSSVARDRRDPRHRARRRRSSNGARLSSTAACHTRSSSRWRRSASCGA